LNEPRPQGNQTLRRVRYLIYGILYSNINYGPNCHPRYSWAGRDQTNQIKGSKTGNQGEKRPENRTPDDTGRHSQKKRLENRSAGQPVTPDNLLTNSARVSDESPQESYHKNNEKPLVLAILGSLPSAGLRKVEYGSTAGNLTICRQILPQSAMSPHKNEEPPSDRNPMRLSH